MWRYCGEMVETLWKLYVRKASAAVAGRLAEAHDVSDRATCLRAFAHHSERAGLCGTSLLRMSAEALWGAKRRAVPFSLPDAAPPLSDKFCARGIQRGKGLLI